MGNQVATGSRIADQYLAEYEVLERAEIEVGASAAETYCAIRNTDLHDPVVAVLFSLPGFPNRMARRLAGLTPEPTAGVVTFGRIAAARRVWVELADVPDRELVLGAMSRFWRRDRPARMVAPSDFAAFAEPGWAKVVLSFSVEPLSESRSLLRYEARAAGTDDAATRRFRRYWRVIRPGVAVAMRRALGHIRTEAEWHECLTGALADR